MKCSWANQDGTRCKRRVRARFCSEHYQHSEWQLDWYNGDRFNQQGSGSTPEHVEATGDVMGKCVLADHPRGDHGAGETCECGMVFYTIEQVA